MILKIVIELIIDRELDLKLPLQMSFITNLLIGSTCLSYAFKI